MKLIRNFLPIIVVLLFLLPAVISLFHFGFFPMHDDEQIARLQQITIAINNWQIPPRWIPDLGFGYGFPLFNFYPPLIYYLGYLFHLVGFSFISSMKLVMGLGFMLSAFFMFLWTRKHYGVLAGIFAALLYTYVPYHAVDLYVRGAFSEFFSFVWIPAVFWAFDRLSEKKTLGNAILAGIFLSLVIITHNLVFIQFIPFFAVYLIYLLFVERKNIKKVLSLFIFSVVSSIGLTLYFTLPSLLEKQYTLVDKILTGELANYKLYFVCPIQFLNSPWGYGGSIPGCVDGLTFQIGKIQLLVSILALVFIMFFIAFRKTTLFNNLKLPIVALILFVFSLFIATSYSENIWNVIQPLSYVQFPWRFLLFTAVFSSFLGGFVIAVLQKYLNKFVLLLVLILLSGACLYSVRLDYKPSSYLSVTDSFYTSKQDLQWRVSRLSYEYVPKGVATKLSDLGTTVLDISEKDLPKKSFEVVFGKMNVNEQTNIPQYKKYAVQVINPGQFRINTFSFPGWTVLVDGKKVKYNDDNKFKLITVTLAKGDHDVRVVFKNTLVRTIGDLVSCGTVLVLMILGIILIIKKKKYA
jgi:hypothetical protein